MHESAACHFFFATFLGVFAFLAVVFLAFVSGFFFVFLALIGPPETVRCGPLCSRPPTIQHPPHDKMRHQGEVAGTQSALRSNRPSAIRGRPSMAVGSRASTRSINQGPAASIL